MRAECLAQEISLLYRRLFSYQEHPSTTPLDLATRGSPHGVSFRWCGTRLPASHCRVDVDLHVA